MEIYVKIASEVFTRKGWRNKVAHMPFTVISTVFTDELKPRFVNNETRSRQINDLNHNNSQNVNIRSASSLEKRFTNGIMVVILHKPKYIHMEYGVKWNRAVFWNKSNVSMMSNCVIGDSLLRIKTIEIHNYEI